MNFAMRPPSTVWEAVPLPTTPPVIVWGWFRPEQAPGSFVVHLPPALWQTPPTPPVITIRILAGGAGMDSLTASTIYGQYVPFDAETIGLIDLPLPPPEGADQQVILWGTAADLPTPASTLSPNAGDFLPGENPTPYFELIEFYWMNILYIESEIRRARQQLEHSLARLNSLNRDLTFEELYAADSADKQHWQDARRWLRDASSSLSRSIKEIDVGLLSSAGQRNRFLDLYEQFVQPRILFPGLKQAAIDFEMHHKSAKNVLQAAQTALHKGTSDGERRANAVLQRIQQKARQKSHQARGKNV